MEFKTEPIEMNTQRVHPITIKKVRIISDLGTPVAKRQKISHTHRVENNENSNYLLNDPTLNANDGANNNETNEVQPNISKSVERINDDFLDSDLDYQEDLLFPELGSINNNNIVVPIYDYNENCEDFHLNEGGENAQSSDIPSKSIETPGQDGEAGTSNASANTASDCLSNEEIEFIISLESAEILENISDCPPNYSCREILVRNSIVHSQTIYGIICGKNSGMQWTCNGNDLDLTVQHKNYLKFLKSNVERLNSVTERLLKDKFKYDPKKFCFQNQSQGQKCQSVNDHFKKQHDETHNWLENLNRFQLWSIITLVLKQPNLPRLVSPLIMAWLNINRDVSKVMCVAKKLAHHEKYKTLETELSEVWNYILKALISSGMKPYFATSILLCFCHQNDFPLVTTRIIYSLQLQQYTYPNYWKCFELLVDRKFQLPHIILAKILENVCGRKNPIRGNDKFILNIAAQVCRIEETDIPQIRDSVNKFLKEYEQLLPSRLKSEIKATVSVKKMPIILEKHIVHKIKMLSLNVPKTNVLQESNNIPSLPLSVTPSVAPSVAPSSVPSESALETNVDNVLISLQQAIESQDNLGIAKILVLNCNAPSRKKIGKKFYYLMQTKNNIGTEIVNISTKIVKIAPKGKDRLLFAKLCIDLIFFLAYNDNWAEAYQVLLQVRYMNYNPVTLKPVVHPFSSVYIAVTCAQVLLNSAHYNSAINIITNNKLLYEDQTKWFVEGKKEDFDLVKNTISTLFLKLLDTKLINIAMKLFKDVIKVQNSIFAPINISSIFNSMLTPMLMNFDRHKDGAMELYLAVYELNEDVQLDELSNRLLIICAMRNQVYNILRILVSYGITSCAYPVKQGKKNTIILNTNLLEEEIMAYMIIWCEWFCNQIVNDSKSNGGININIELKEANNRENDNYQELPNILKSVDSSIAGALLRVNAAIGKLLNIQDSNSVETMLNCNTIKLSTSISRQLISSACQFVIHKEENQ